MGTLWASSGSTLGHGPTTRTHAFLRPPEWERGRPRHTHTHTIYAVRRVYSAGAHTQWLRPPRRSLTGWLRRHSPCQNRPPPSPTHLLFPRISLRKRRAAPTVSPPRVERVRTPRRVRGSHKAVPPHPPPHPIPAHCFVSAAVAIVFSLVFAIAAAALHRLIVIRPSRAPVELFHQAE